MSTPQRPPAHAHTLCPVDDCTRIVRNVVNADNEMVPLCDYHYGMVGEMFGMQSVFRQRDKSIVDWKDNVYHSDIPEQMHGNDPMPYWIPFRESDWEIGGKMDGDAPLKDG